jgi:hypothetical protein
MNWKGCGRKQEGYQLGCYIHSLPISFVVYAGRYVTGTDTPGHQVAMATKFCTVVSTLCGFSVWNFYVTLLVPMILRWLLDFWKICAPFSQNHWHIILGNEMHHF